MLEYSLCLASVRNNDFPFFIRCTLSSKCFRVHGSTCRFNIAVFIHQTRRRKQPAKWKKTTKKCTAAKVLRLGFVQLVAADCHCRYTFPHDSNISSCVRKRYSLDGACLTSIHHHIYTFQCSSASLKSPFVWACLYMTIDSALEFPSSGWICLGYWIDLVGDSIQLMLSIWMIHHGSIKLALFTLIKSVECRNLKWSSRGISWVWWYSQ